MEPAQQKVYDRLLAYGKRGVVWDDFPKGFAIRSRMSELRQMGLNIITKIEELPDGCRRARYFLLNKKRG